MAAAAGFWDRVAGRYARKPVADEASYQRKLQVTCEYLRADMEVLEFGCGTGSTAIAHAPYVKRIEAIDISSRMVEIARRKAEAGHVGNVAFRTADIDEFDAREARFDAVMGHSILHLLESREAAVAKVHGLLKPGGVFVTSTVCLGRKFWWLRAIAPAGRSLGLLPLLRFFSRQELEASLTAAGFAIEHCWQPGKGKAVFIVARKPTPS